MARGFTRTEESPPYLLVQAIENPTCDDPKRRENSPGFVGCLMGPSGHGVGGKRPHLVPDIASTLSCSTPSSSHCHPIGIPVISPVEFLYPLWCPRLMCDVRCVLKRPTIAAGDIRRFKVSVEATLPVQSDGAFGSLPRLRSTGTADVAAPGPRSHASSIRGRPQQEITCHT
jgi:hypothetical protein